MTTLKLVEIKELPLGELSEQIKKSRIELVDLRMKFTSRQLENPSLIKMKRKEIARLLTMQTQKVLAGEVAQLEKPKKGLKKEKKSQEEKSETKKAEIKKTVAKKEEGKKVKGKGKKEE